MKKSIKILLYVTTAFVMIICVCCVLWATALNPHRGVIKTYEVSNDLDYVLSQTEAKADFDYFEKHLKSRHPLWLEEETNVRNEIEKALANGKELIEKINEIKVIDLWRIYSGILSLLHDGHTSIIWNKKNNQKFINDFTQVINYGNPLFMDGVKTEEIFEIFKSLTSWEIEKSAESRFYGTYALSEHYERLCGIDTSDGVTFTYNIDGKNTDFHYDFVEGSKVIYPAEEKKVEKESEEVIKDEFDIHSEQIINEMYAFCNDKSVFYKIDYTYDLGLLVLTSCDYDKYYKETVKNFFDEVINKNISNVVVDLRGNGGGSSLVADEFIKYLNIDKFKSFDSAVRYGNFLMKNKDVVVKNPPVEQKFKGNVYVLTDIYTYSSAMDFAMFITDNKLGTIIGEASGNKPECYGDRLDFMLPKSKLILTVSYKKWYRVDRSKSDQLIEPDIPCESKKALSKLYSML
jgi:hypothetical protein